MVFASQSACRTILSRKPSGCAMQLPARYSTEQMSGEGTIFDLSTEGSTLQSQNIPAVSTSLTLEIDPPDEESPVVIHRAAVRWSSGKTFGLEFMHIQPAERERLHQLVTVLATEPDG